MCVQIAFSPVSQRLWENKHCWHFQLTANSCFWVMSRTETNSTGCSGGVFFFFFLAAAWEGEHFKDCSLPFTARPSGKTFFGFLQQNVTRYPGHPVAVGITQFMLRIVGFPVADSQVSDHEKRKRNTDLPQNENEFVVSCILSLFRVWSFRDNQ